jgi:hypothetical protein
MIHWLSIRYITEDIQQSEHRLFFQPSYHPERLKDATLIRLLTQNRIQYKKTASI